MEVSFKQSQTVHLKINAQLKQSVELLQSSAEELAEMLQEQAVQNPLLSISWADRRRPRNGKRFRLAESRENADYFAMLPAPAPTLEDKLVGQLRLIDAEPGIYRAAKFLAGNLNPSGYLDIDLEEAGQYLGQDSGMIDAALRLLQSLEPAGAGARSLKECLLLQIARRPDAPPFADVIVNRYLQEIGSGRLKLIARELRVDEGTVREAVQFIKGLEPRPGIAYESAPPKYIQPDAVIFKDGLSGGYRVEMNEWAMPKVAIQAEYLALLKNSADPDARTYLRENYQSAKRLIYSLELRTSTLQRLLEAIVEHQQAYFERGVHYIKPLTLQAIADQLNVHVSTVSRAARNKYVLTPHGIVEIKYFFSSGLPSADRASASSTGIKERIRQIIQAEDKSRPLSDQQIMQELMFAGIQISRRTVMKYREDMNILSSRLRSTS